MSRHFALLPVLFAFASPLAAQDCAAPAGSVVVRHGAIVRAALEALRIQKDELETTDQHQARQVAHFNNSLAPLTISDGSIIVMESSFARALSYDADARVASLHQLSRNYRGLNSLQYPESRYHAVVIDNDVSESSYNTTNGFGAPVVVRKYNVRQVAFAWPADVVHAIGDGGFDQPLRLSNFPPERVQLLRDGGSYRFIGRLASPMLRAAYGPRITPTFQSPVERETIVATINVTPLAVCHIDENGRVLSQWNIQQRRERR